MLRKFARSAPHFPNAFYENIFTISNYTLFQTINQSEMPERKPSARHRMSPLSTVEAPPSATAAPAVPPALPVS